MANTAPVLIRTELALSQDHIHKLCEAVAGDDPESEKITSLAIGTLEALAQGGMLLEAQEIQRIEQSIGAPVDTVEDILPFIEAGAGRADGKLHGTWNVDPVYEPNMQAIADFQNSTVEEVAQRIIDEMMDQGHLLGEILPAPHRVLMSPTDHDHLQNLLGGEFHNGTELAQLVVQALGGESPMLAPVAAEPADAQELFE